MLKACIVDDAAVMRLRLKDILEQKYKVVAEASNGEEALRAYEIYNPDFITLDITMPKMNGIEVIKNLLAKYPDAKIIIVSAIGQKQIVFNALGLGAKDFIVKPFDNERVLQAVERLFK